MATQRDFRHISTEEEQTVQSVTRLFSELTTYRNVYAGQCEETAALIDPDSRNTFFVGSYNFPGMKKTQYQVDSSGTLALQQFCAITDSMITPKNRLWHGLETDDYLMKQKGVRQFYENLRNVVFNYRYRPDGNFHGQNFRIWKSLGAYGNSIMFVDALDRRWHNRPGLRYKAVPFGECFFAENHQGMVTTLVRWFRLTAAQACEKFQGVDWLPPQLHAAMEKDLQTPFQFLHCVRPRGDNDYDPERLDEKGLPYESYYVSIDGKCLMPQDPSGKMEGGYQVFPYAVSRYDQMPGEVYGRGPAQLVLPGLKTLNAQKSTFLKQGHRAADPLLLTSDDGPDFFDWRNGAMNKGGVTADGKLLIHTLPTGNIAISEKMMLSEKGDIENMFLTPLFKTLMNNPNMTATQVVELINERAMLVAPTLGRQHSEYAGGLVPRELSLLVRMRAPNLPQIPPALREAGAGLHFEVTDTSPLAAQAKASQAAGGLRTLDIANQIANYSGDTSIYDHFAFDRMIPEIAVMNEMPANWTSTPQEFAQKQKNRAAQAQQQQAIQAMPAKAAMIKAQAVASKANPLGAGQQQPAVPAQ